MSIKRIGIITSGGDCGGLNGIVKGAAQMANVYGVSVFAIPNGYAGLYNLVEMEHLVELSPSRVDPVQIGLAGSEAGHSRVKISNIEDENKYERIKQGLKKFKIDALVISGGDDTGSVVLDLLEHGIKCVHAPKTMDLDLMSYSVGGDSTINRIAEFLRDLRTTGRTHNRILVIEVFGRYAGHTAFRGGVAAEASAILIPEIPVDFNYLYNHMKEVYVKRVIESDVHAGTYIIVVAEGLKDVTGTELYDESVPRDPFGHRKLAGAGKYVVQELDKRLKKDGSVKRFMKEQGMYVEGIYDRPEIRNVTPGHLVRCGFTSAYDANFGMEAGAGAVLLLLNDKSGVTVTGFTNGIVHYMSVKEAIEQRYVDLNQVALYEQLGICFGRKTEKLQPSFKKLSGEISRIY